MAIREINTARITRTVKQLCIEATTVLNPDVLEAYAKGLSQEVSPQGKEVFKQLAENARIAREESIWTHPSRSRRRCRSMWSCN